MSNTQKIVHPLPTGKRAVDVFADYLRYLYICAAQYVCDTHVGGHTLWKSVKEEVDYVLSHPNGWGGREQSMMREAALLAGLISKQDDYSRLTFVSEGEASLHFCIHSGILKKSDMKACYLSSSRLWYLQADRTTRALSSLMQAAEPLTLALIGKSRGMIQTS